MSAELESRIVRLEETISFQQQTIEALDTEVRRAWSRIEQLSAEMSRQGVQVDRQFEALRAEMDAPDMGETPPDRSGLGDSNRQIG
jgi:uncharacterized coiled-coil protein SlyX